MVESAVLVGLGIDVFKTVAPRGMAWARTRFFGKSLLVVGPSRAGKTSLVDFLRYGRLEPQRETATSLSDDKFTVFAIPINGSTEVQLRIKQVRSLPGTKKAGLQAGAIRGSSCEILLIVLDGSKPDDGLQWLMKFASGIQAAVTSKPSCCESLQDVIVVLNKDDLRKWDDKYPGKVRHVLRKELNGVLQLPFTNIPVVETILVAKDRAASLAQDLVFLISKRAHRRETGND